MSAVVKIELGKYRGFQKNTEISLAVPNGEPGSGFTILVGPNNTGKSTILATLQKTLISNRDRILIGIDERHDAVATLRVLLESPNGQGAVHFKNTDGAQYRRERSPEALAAPTLRYLPSRRPWNDATNITDRIDGASHEQTYWQNKEGNQHFVDGRFGSAFATVSEEPGQKLALTKIVQEIDPQISAWGFDSFGTDHFLSFTGPSGKPHRANHLGDGVSNVLRIAYLLHTLRPGEIILLDEPELSLHPQAQRRLHALLRNVAAEHQVVISTHSPHFVNWEDMENRAVIYRTHQGGDGCYAARLSEQTVDRILKIALDDRKNRKLYDVLARELFFADRICFVEGQEDVHVMNYYSQTEGVKIPDIVGYGSGGAANIVNWLHMAKDLRIKAAAIYDGDEIGTSSKSDADKEFAGEEKIQTYLLPAEDIVDKPADDKKKAKNGVFDKDWKVKPDLKSPFDEMLSQANQFLA